MSHSSKDPFNLARFVNAQASQYDRALGELRAGFKQSHWIWFVLPQLRGLGTSPTADLYGMSSAEEAKAYLAHPVLGPRLDECVETLSALQGVSAAAVLGELDALKYRSCLTLFAAVADEPARFKAALRKHFAGVADQKTLKLLAGDKTLLE